MYGGHRKNKTNLIYFSSPLHRHHHLLFCCLPVETSNFTIGHLTLLILCVMSHVMSIFVCVSLYCTIVTCFCHISGHV